MCALCMSMCEKTSKKHLIATCILASCDCIFTTNMMIYDIDNICYDSYTFECHAYYANMFNK